MLYGIPRVFFFFFFFFPPRSCYLPIFFFLNSALSLYLTVHTPYLLFPFIKKEKKKKIEDWDQMGNVGWIVIQTALSSNPVNPLVLEI